MRTRMGWLLWLILALAVCIVSATSDFRRTVVPAYRGAAVAWFESQPIYELTSVHGFLYLPSAAALNVPFVALPVPVHEFVFRLLIIAMLAWATWRLAHCVARAISRDAFLGMSVLIAPTAIGSAMAGQMNIVLAAGTALAAADMMEKRWNRAAFWLGLGLALKPQMAVLLLLAGAIFPAMRHRVALALAAALLVPFLLQEPAYVWEQYRLCAMKLQLSGNPAEANVRNNDFYGLLTSLGVDLPGQAKWALRLVLAPLTLLATWYSVRRRSPAYQVVITLAWSAAYLMLFNPRTEGGSYVIAAVPVAALAAFAAAPRFRKWEVTLLALITVGWTASYPISQALHGLAELLLGTGNVGDFRYWLSPFLGVVFTGYLTVLMLKGRDGCEQPSCS